MTLSVFVAVVPLFPERSRAVLIPHFPAISNLSGVFFKRVCDAEARCRCGGDAAASFSRRDINAAAAFYKRICCCDIYSVSF